MSICREEPDERIKAIEKIYRENRELILRLKELSNKCIEKLKQRYGKNIKVRIMNFCGTHEWTTVYYGIRSLLPENIELVAGPGCPVCITPSYYIEKCIELCLRENFTVYTYGDTFKVPTLRKIEGARSLEEAKALGGSVVVVYSFLEAVTHFKTNNIKNAIFLGIGFETVAPAYATMFYSGKVPKGFYFLSVVRLTPPAAVYSIEVCKDRLSKVLGEEVLFGVIAPGHVSTITGGQAWEILCRKFSIPVVVSGFEPVDLMLSICEILRQLLVGEAKVVIEYTRAVSWEGNVYAKKIMDSVFVKRKAAWRGIGFIDDSGLYLREEYAEWDAFCNLVQDLSENSWKYDLPRLCKCGEIMLGLAYPTDCPLFLKECRPERPVGPCMVSSEGTCSIWARYGTTSIVKELAEELGL